MKNFKKIMAVMIAAVLVLGLSSIAFAGDEPAEGEEGGGATPATTSRVYTVENPGDADAIDDHSFNAYQIFTAESYDSETGKFGGLAFADGAESLLGDYEDINALADSLGGNDSPAATAFAEAAYAIKDQLSKATDTSKLGMGLWLVVDETEGQVPVINWANLFVAPANDTPMSVISKVDAPESGKTVTETNDTTGEITPEQEGADYDIGDHVPFELTATLPGNYEDYDTYHLTFHDQMSTGLTFDNNIKVYFGDTEVAAANYNVLSGENLPEGSTDTFQVVFTYADLEAIGVTNGSVIKVQYTAELNNNAVIGAVGNTNTSWITYDNNPNSDQDGEEGGKTPDDVVIVFTYKITANKVDGNNSALSGAGFTLYKYEAGAEGDNKWVQKGDEITGVTTFDFTGKDTGAYKLVETTVPTGYNKADDLLFYIEGTYSDTDNNGTPELTALAVYDATEAGDKGTTLLSTGNEGATFTATVESGVAETNIVNNSGSTLPSTGGIGTTIFYIIGGVIVVAAVIFLIVRSKKSSAK